MTLRNNQSSGFEKSVIFQLRCQSHFWLLLELQLPSFFFTPDESCCHGHHIQNMQRHFSLLSLDINQFKLSCMGGLLCWIQPDKYCIYFKTLYVVSVLMLKDPECSRDIIVIWTWHVC